MLHRIKSFLANNKFRSVLGILTGCALMVCGSATLFMVAWNWLPISIHIGFWQSCLMLLSLFIFIAIIMSIINTMNSIFVVISTIIFVIKTRGIREKQGQEQVHMNNIFGRFLNIKDNLE